jgi:serine/threonine-protein kinase RsbW
MSTVTACNPRDRTWRTRVINIRSEVAEAQRVQNEVETQLRAREFSEGDIFSCTLALEEALVNAIKHGNRLDRNKKVCIAYCIRPERFDVVIQDERAGFVPADVADPTSLDNLERPCGRGLLLMRHFMDEVTFNERGNAVSMTKLRSPHQLAG